MSKLDVMLSADKVGIWAMQIVTKNPTQMRGSEIAGIMMLNKLSIRQIKM